MSPALPKLSLCHLSDLPLHGVLTPSCLPPFLPETGADSFLAPGTHLGLSEHGRVDMHFGFQAPTSSNKKETRSSCCWLPDPREQTSHLLCSIFANTESIPAPGRPSPSLGSASFRGSASGQRNARESAGTSEERGACTSSPGPAAAKKRDGKKSSWKVGNREGKAKIKPRTQGVGRNYSCKDEDRSVILDTGLIRYTIHTQCGRSQDLYKKPTTPNSVICLRTVKTDCCHLTVSCCEMGNL